MNVVARASRRPAFLESAKRIGAILCRDAIWDGGACNWIGHSEGDPADSPSVSRRVSALGPDVYGGTAGIALFLAQLHRAAGEPRLRDTAVGAIRQALARVAEAPVDLAPLGLYTGRLGIAWAAARVGRWLGDSDLEACGLALAQELVAGPRDAPCLDVMGGTAGAILALLELGGPGSAAAVRLGDELAAAPPQGGTLTGMSHGAAGIGLALAALHSRTQSAHLRDAGIAAFAYEDRWFDAERQNWRDLRKPPLGGEPFTMAWCHGAPGSGLARLRASTLIPDKAASWRPTIDAAATAAASWLALHVRDRAMDVTLCHGLAGVTELLSAASPRHDDLVARAWRAAIAAHERAASWPSGVASRAHNPSLMVGLAGVGHALLRLHDPVTESLLVP